MSEKHILLAFSNELAGSQTEEATLQEIFPSGSYYPPVRPVTNKSLAKAMLDVREPLLLFHYSGHAGKKGLNLDQDNFLATDRLKRLVSVDGVAPRLVFINGCHSYGLVSSFISAGSIIVIATNESIDDDQAWEIAELFYTALYKGWSINDALEKAQVGASVDKISSPIFVKPGDSNEQITKASWAICIHQEYPQAINWKIDDLKSQAQLKPNQNPAGTTTTNNINHSGNGDIVLGNKNTNNYNK